MNRERAERCTILRGLVGSTVHGLNVNDGIEDRDEMGVCVEPMQDVMSLWSPFEQFIYRNTERRETVTHGAGNVFADLGFSDGAGRLAKLRLAYAINQLLKNAGSRRQMQPKC